MRRTAAVVAVLVLTACSGDLVVTAGASSRLTDPTSSTTAPSTTSPSTTTSAAPTPTTTTSSSTTTTSSTMTTSSTSVGAMLEPAWYPQLGAAVADLSAGNASVSVSVRRVGVEPFDMALGVRNDGAPADSSTPFVLASVSKLLTAVAVARLVEDARITEDDPVPWSAMGIAHDPAWDSVTVRELIDHTGGMPVNQRSWLDDPSPCSVPLEEALAGPPTGTRGTWRYSNGNYCALGLLVEHLSGLTMGDAVSELVLAPAGVLDGPYLARDDERPTAAPYPRGVARLLRLGGAGEWLASSSDVADVVAAITPTDRAVVRYPGLMVDQYGWGHTGTLDGAKTCAWVIDADRTVVVALVAGERPGTGGGVCDRLLPALAADLGLPALGKPVRFPI
ncbi:MAG: serine hydrolase domain-containing protein [Ilumatobacteraceae bacterium]